MPAGHPQGFVEALSQLYVDMADQVETRLAAYPVPPAFLLLPGLAEGVRGMRIIDAVLRSGQYDHPMKRRG